MNTHPLYSEAELTEITAFLRKGYIETTLKFHFANPTDPDAQVKPEIVRLRKKTKTSHPETFSAETVDELTEAIHSPFAPDLKAIKQQGLKALQDQMADGSASAGATSSPRESLPRNVLRHCMQRLCGDPPNFAKSTFAISSANLSLLLAHLKIDIVYAPVVVYVATRLRDYGVPILCASYSDYLKQAGLPPLDANKTK